MKLKRRSEPKLIPEAVEVKVHIGDSVIASTAGCLVSDRYDDEYDIIELHETIGKYNQRILVLNGTEDLLIVMEDAEKTYNKICENAKKYFEETGMESNPHRPTIYTVGKAVGGSKPYSHFDLVFGEDAPQAVFPVILSFLDGNCEGRYTAFA